MDSPLPCGSASLHAALSSALCACRHLAILPPPGVTSWHNLSASPIHSSLIAITCARACSSRSVHTGDSSALWLLRHWARSLAVVASGQSFCTSSKHGPRRGACPRASVLYMAPPPINPKNAIHTAWWNRFLSMFLSSQSCNTCVSCACHPTSTAVAS